MDEQLQIKVADFGLAKDVYTTNYYRQKSTGRIPAKWMAPEALHDRISNEKTDVVSLLVHSLTVSLYKYVYYYSGHMGSHAGRCLVLDALLIQLFLIMKY